MNTNRWGAGKVAAGTIGAAAIVLSLALLRGPFLSKAQAEPERREKHLFVWAGDQARTNPDFLAVINFDEHSNGYGKVITTVPLPEPGATGNAPFRGDLPLRMPS
jgi:hypothetical protein